LIFAAGEGDGDEAGGWVKTLPFSLSAGQNPGTPGEPQNSWDLWMFIPLKMVLIGIDPYPCYLRDVKIIYRNPFEKTYFFDLQNQGTNARFTVSPCRVPSIS
jgi:hypothetical protein